MNDKLTSGTSYTAGAMSTLFGAVSLNEIALFIGIVLSVGTFLINWLYKHKTYKLQKEIIKENKQAD